VTLVQRIFGEKRRIIGPLVILAVANVIAYVVIVFPLDRQVAAGERDQRAAQDVLRAARADYQTARATVAGKQEADASLRQFYSDVLPRTASAAQRVTYLRLAQLAQAANVHLERGANGIKTQKNSSLAKLSTSYRLSGDYRDVRQFIYSLETAPEFIVLENISLASGGADAGETLSVQIDVSTYFRADDGS
jgi:Tfp pilus assembly protein PilO